MNQHILKNFDFYLHKFCLFLLGLGFALLLPQAQAQSPPNPPFGLGIFDRSHVSFQVWWHAPDTGDGAPITGYDVRYRDTAEFQVWPHTAHTTNTKIEIDGLSPGVSYEVQARAVSADGNSAWSESTWTRTMTYNHPLTFPSNLVASGITGTSVRVSWIPPYTVDDAVLTGYEVKYRVYAVEQGVLEDLLDAGHTGTEPFFIITGLFADTIYNIQVIALTSDGKRHYSQHLFLTTAGFRPDPPAEITAVRTPTTIQINWNAPQTPDDNPITKYEVRFRPAEVLWTNGIPRIEPFLEVSTTGPETTIELKDLRIGTSYEIGVRTVTADSKSSWSPITYVVTRPTFRMEPPTISERTSTSLRVNWKTPQFPDDNTIIGYKVRYGQAVVGQNVPSAYTEVNTKGTETTLKITGLKPSTSYEIGVQALGANGNSLWSNSVYDSTYSAYPINPPTDITASVRTANSLRINWKKSRAAEGITITKYQVRYRQTVFGQNAPSAYTEMDTKGTETNINITGLKPSTSYEIGIKALGTNASSLWSAPVYITTYSAYPITAPSGLTISEKTSTSFRLNWKKSDAIEGVTITGYKVRYRPVALGNNPSTRYLEVHTKTTETTLKITGLKPSTIYEVGVQALSAKENGPWSQAYYTATTIPPPVITEADIAMDRIIFNELRNASNSDALDWVELRNISKADINFDGWKIQIGSKGSSRTIYFPSGTTLPAGKVLLLLNADPSKPGMPLADPDGNSHRYLVLEQELTLPQADFTMILQSRNAWEDVAGNYFFEEVKPPTAAALTVDKAWYRDKSDTRGYQADAWTESGYHGGIGYDDDADPNTSLGTPGYLKGDLNADGVTNIQDLTLLSSNMGQTGQNVADLNGDGIVNVQDLVLLSALISANNN